MLQKAFYKYPFQLLNKLISTAFICISCTLYLIILMNDLLAGMFGQILRKYFRSFAKAVKLVIPSNRYLHYKP